tara:strand:+ start:1683 stop:2786 length:1104 start_codon:yes stop_codon:yes gene_type:complete
MSGWTVVTKGAKQVAAKGSTGGGTGGTGGAGDEIGGTGDETGSETGGGTGGTGDETGGGGAGGEFDELFGPADSETPEEKEERLRKEAARAEYKELTKKRGGQLLDAFQSQRKTLRPKPVRSMGGMVIDPQMEEDKAENLGYLTQGGPLRPISALIYPELEYKTGLTFAGKKTTPEKLQQGIDRIDEKLNDPNFSLPLPQQVKIGGPGTLGAEGTTLGQEPYKPVEARSESYKLPQMGMLDELDMLNRRISKSRQALPVIQEALRPGANIQQRYNTELYKEVYGDSPSYNPLTPEEKNVLQYFMERSKKERGDFILNREKLMRTAEELSRQFDEDLDRQASLQKRINVLSAAKSRLEDQKEAIESKQ